MERYMQHFLNRKLAQEIFGVVPLKVLILGILTMASLLYRKVKIPNSPFIFGLCLVIVASYSTVVLILVRETRVCFRSAREPIDADQTYQQQSKSPIPEEEEEDGEDMPPTPDDATLVKALKALRVKAPSLGRAKVIELFRKEKGWQISDRRMKDCMNANSLGAIDPKEFEALQEEKKKAKKEILPHIPLQPLGEQLNYSKRTKGRIVIYGSGDYDYCVTPVPDMCAVTEKNQKLVADFLKIFKNRRIELHRQEYLAHQPYFKVLWKMYKRAAEHIDNDEDHKMTMEMVKRQFMAEYRVDPLLGEPQESGRKQRIEKHEAWIYKKGKMDILKELHKTRPDLVILDANGNPVWNEATHGQFSMRISAINRFGLEPKRII